MLDSQGSGDAGMKSNELAITVDALTMHHSILENLTHVNGIRMMQSYLRLKPHPEPLRLRCSSTSVQGHY